MLKPQIPLTKQLAPLIIFLAIVILCTLVISNRRAAKKRAQEAAILPMEEQQLRMELSPFKYSGNMVMEGDYGERSSIPRVDSTLQQAADYCDNGEFDQAEDVLRTALVFHHTNPKLLSMLGSVLYMQGKYKDAEMVFRRQAFLRPNDTSVYNNLGAALAKQRKFREAITTAEKGLRMEPASSIAALNLSGIHSMAGNTEKAIKLCEEARNGGCRDRNLWINLCTYYLGTGDVKKFRENLKEGLAIDPDSPALADFRAVSYILEGNYKAAGSLLTDLLEKATPAFADPYIHLAMVYLYYGEREKAQDALSKARETVFHITSIYSRDDVTRLGAAVDDDWQIMPAVNAIFSDTLSFINGKVPEWGKADEPCHEMEKTHNGLELEEPASISYEDEEEKEDSDDVSTELSESDEEWIRRHS